MKPLRKKSAFVAAILASAGIAHAARITFDEGLDTSQAMFAPFITQGAALYQAGFVISPTAPGAESGDLAGRLDRRFRPGGHVRRHRLPDEQRIHLLCSP